MLCLADFSICLMKILFKALFDGQIKKLIFEPMAYMKQYLIPRLGNVSKYS